MTPERRVGLDRDAGGDDPEENAVCYLQILLADELPGVGPRRDSARTWTRGATASAWAARAPGSKAMRDDARIWLAGSGVIDGRQPTDRRPAMLNCHRLVTRVAIAATRAYLSACSAHHVRHCQRSRACRSAQVFRTRNARHAGIYVRSRTAKRRRERRAHRCATSPAAPARRPARRHVLVRRLLAERQQVATTASSAPRWPSVASSPCCRTIGSIPSVKFPDVPRRRRARRRRGCSNTRRNSAAIRDAVVLMGHSAGAHIAAYLALNRDFLAKRGAQARMDRRARRALGPLRARAQHARAARDLRRALERVGLAACSFRRLAGAADVPGARPRATAVVSVEQTEKLRDALEAQRVRVEAELYPGTRPRRHGGAFSQRPRAEARRRFDQAVAFLDSLTSIDRRPSRIDPSQSPARW